MKTDQFYLYHLKKNIKSNKIIKPLMYRIHLIFLKLTPIFKYCGFSIIFFLKTTNKKEKLRVYTDTNHLIIINMFIVFPSNIIEKINDKNIKKKHNYIEIYLKGFVLGGIYKLLTFFYYKNKKESIEGIYVLKIRKPLEKRECKNNNSNYVEDSTTDNKFYLYFQNNSETILNFDFKNIKFLDKNSYNYINTFCEFFYLPLIFPCLQDNIYKANFKLSISFQIKLKGSKNLNNNFKLSYLSSYNKINKHINYLENINKLQNKNTKKRIKKCKEKLKYANTKNERNFINVINPSNLVVTNSKLKNIHYSKIKVYFNSFLLKKHSINKSIYYIIMNLLKNKYGNLYIIRNYKKRKFYYSKKINKYNNKKLSKSNKEKEFITYEYHRTNKIVHYTFCLFIGLYFKIYFKIRGLHVYIFIEKSSSYNKSKYIFFINILKSILTMFLKINIFRKKLTEEKFLQFILLSKYKYIGEENYNCFTFLISIIEVNENDNIYKKLLCIKLVIHEIFHSLWGNCLYFKKDKYLWCKEGLTRYYELKFSETFLKKIKKNCKCILSISYILDSFFYVQVADTLNTYNHTLNIDNKVCYKYIHKNILKKNKNKRNNNHFYKKDIHHFYNFLTYNKGMNIFKMISVICNPYFDIIMNFIYHTFFNHSISYKKILIFFHFFFIHFHIKPFFLNYNGYIKRVNQLKTIIIKKKKFQLKNLVRNLKKKIIHKNNVIYIYKKSKRKKVKKKFKKIKSATYLHSHKSILSWFHLNFVKISFKKSFLTYYKKIYRKNITNKVVNENKIKRNIILAKKYTKKNILKNILENYINIVGPPKIFVKFLKNKSKLLIVQKHFYYDNYEQKFKETNILFHIPIIFIFNNKIYKILLKKKFILIDVEIKNKKYLNDENKKKKKKKFSENTIIINPKNKCYFSYHFVNMYSFKFLINSIKNRKSYKYEIFNIIINIILNYLIHIKSRNQAKCVNSLILRQLLLVYKLLQTKVNEKCDAYIIGIFLCIEFFNCYFHFSSYFINIENNKLKMKIKKEITKNKYFDKMDRKIDFLLKDFRSYLSQIFFFFKESICTM
ncbi:M1-family alanyl aminopeptidase, putative [Plasmodium gallinaceum]|uniref:M1-family alanyl aminopeptidase, putative n=1 Tax=Plasmodium gallinaceum TaxID=5849 RepID=A0A1J1GV55_PLAGA|nr:M1-family alanyl aminopeptidase, putative [Plasmodium gallinaceum]CRG94922.1 M1-family alanyl aminopeptidase, putative [Plasmodium gallinaceum]